MQSSVPHDQLVQAIQRIVPVLNHGSHKGQSGRVGVVGGSREYTGAPYFAAMLAMRMGVDLSYVFCTPSAAPVIKGYSPELIVMPMLHESQHDENREQSLEAYDYHQKCLGFIERLSVLIIGPGLGDDPQAGGQARTGGHHHLDYTAFIERLSVLITGQGLGDDPQLEWPLEDIIRCVRELDLPLIIDGSGLNYIATRLHLIKGYANCILTPNIAELGRLAQGAGVTLEGKIGDGWQKQAQELARALEGPLLLSKGAVDVLTDGTVSLVVTADGSPRRCGGQGDILTGTIAAFTSWQNAAAKRQQKEQQQEQQQEQTEPSAAAPAAGSLPPLLLAGYAGCLTMRAAAVLTFKAKGRSMVAGDMIEALGDPVLQHSGLLPAAAAAAAAAETAGPADG